MRRRVQEKLGARRKGVFTVLRVCRARKVEEEE